MESIASRLRKSRSGTDQKEPHNKMRCGPPYQSWWFPLIPKWGCWNQSESVSVWKPHRSEGNLNALYGSGTSLSQSRRKITGKIVNCPEWAAYPNPGYICDVEVRIMLRYVGLWTETVFLLWPSWRQSNVIITVQSEAFSRFSRRQGEVVPKNNKEKMRWQNVLYFKLFL